MADQTSTIPKGWKMTTLGDVLAIRNGKSRPKDGNKYPVYGGNGVLGYADEYNVDEEIIIVGRVGAYCGSIFFENEKFWLSDNALGVLAKENSNIDFLYYLLKKVNLNKQAIGGAQPLLTQGIINQIEVLTPQKVEEEQAIAAVLSSLDEKIEFLREQSRTLEATAQAIFKEWFVNFHFPGATGKIFDSEFGKIPDGWRVGKLGDEFDITIGRTPPRLETEWFSDNPTGKKWISIRDIGNSETYISNTAEYLTDEAIAKFNIPIIPENTAILSFKMTVGKLAITTEEMLSNEAIAHIKIKEKSNLSTEFIYLFLKGLDFNSLGSTSSIVTAINSTMMKALGVLVPEDQMMQGFNAVIQPIFAKLKNNNFQIQTLSALRDALLPKLMSGKVRVMGFND